MKPLARRALRFAALAGVLLLVAGVVAPQISAERYRPQIQAALEKALGRKVEITGPIHFNVFTGVGFAVETVTINEDPSIGIEPIAYVPSLEAVPRIWSLFTRKLEFASIRLDDASINLAKTGAPGGPGRWNLEVLLNRSLVMTFPEIHVRNGRINFKFSDIKSVFYLTETDLDVYPPARGTSDWSVRFSGGPARTDRPSRPFGYLAARGRWTPANRTRPDRLELDVQLEKSALGDIVTLVRGRDAGIHGTVSSRMRLAGTLDNVEIAGRIVVEDVHRWDLLPPHGQGWPLNLRGRLNLWGQTLELESSSTEREALPLSVRFRAADYLSQPRWAVAVNWNRFPLAPVLELARHMGAEVPERLKLAGIVDGAVAYDSTSGLGGEVAFHDAAVTIPDSPPLRCEQARMFFDAGGVRLEPALVRTQTDDQAQLEGSYRWDTPALDLAISTNSMHVESLRAQVALAAVPWLEQMRAGVWSGTLHYRQAPSAAAEASGRARWSGLIELKDAEVPVPGLAEPVKLAAARAQIQGTRVLLDRMDARIGKLAVLGDYRYEPAAVRPHRFRLAMAHADAAEIERLLAPTLRRSRGLLARAFGLGRAPEPEWLVTRRMEGTLQVGTLTLAGARLDRLRGHAIWDGTRARLENLAARWEDGTVAGSLTVNLRGTRPAYLLAARLKTVNCRSGKMDVEGVVETRGMGAELLANLRSQGIFNGRALELGSMPVLPSVSGAYRLVWGRPEPRLRFWDLQLASGEELYTGQGASQEDGRLLFQLSSGTREMRVSGTLARLHLEETPAP